MAEFLPHHGLRLILSDKRMRWAPRLLACVAIFMAWCPAGCLKDRFAHARQAVAAIYRSRRQPGRTHEGFAKALVTHGALILAQLADYWRQCIATVAAACWMVGGWVLIGFDGTKIDCPRTKANEKAFGVSGKNNSGPQMLLSCLFHIGSGILWAFKRTGIRAHGERGHLMQMIPLLPAHAMLLADAGLTGYELFKAVLEHGADFLIRVGSNVHLITQLGYAQREGKDTVYLWPLPKQGRDRRRKMPKNLRRVQKPLVLRLIRLKDAKGRPVCLLTNVLDKRRLSPAMAAKMYQMRWGIEVMWRDLKQTLGHDKVRSGTPRRAEAELDWAMAGLWMLQMMSVKKMLESRKQPRQYSPAASLRVVRGAMENRPPKPKRKRRSLAADLAEAVKDEYRRHGSKKARHNPRKCPRRPPGEPLARKASQKEKAIIQRLLNQPPPESLAA